MNKIKNYFKAFGYYFTILFIYLIIISILYYFELLSINVINIINYIFIILVNCYGGYRISRYERSKGYLNGFLLGLILSIIFSIITLIMHEYNISTIIYYITLILSSMIGGIIGVPNNN